VDLNSIVQQAANEPILPKQEQIALAMEIYNKTPKAMEARNKLVKTALRLIIKTVWAWSRRYPHLADDLVAEGMIGYNIGLGKWKPGVNSATPLGYSLNWSKAYIANYLVKNVSVVKFGTTQWQRAAFFKEGGKDPDDTDDEKVKWARVRLQGDFSLDSFVGDGTKTFLDGLADENQSVDEVLEEIEEASIDSARLNAAMDSLMLNERRVIELRFLRSKTLSEVGEEMGFSRERARQLEVRAMGKLKQMLRTDDMKRCKHDIKIRFCGLCSPSPVTIARLAPPEPERLAGGDEERRRLIAVAVEQQALASRKDAAPVVPPAPAPMAEGAPMPPAFVPVVRQQSARLRTLAPENICPNCGGENRTRNGVKHEFCSRCRGTSARKPQNGVERVVKRVARPEVTLPPVQERPQEQPHEEPEDEVVDPIVEEIRQGPVELRAPATRGLRDDIAMSALRGLLARAGPSEYEMGAPEDIQLVAKRAYQLADAMMAARDRDLSDADAA
jgi:RNA polymerase sigma-32 factor